MKLLAIETSTEACSVALWIDGEVSERHEIAPRRHSTLVLPWAEALLADAGLRRAQLDAIACGRGPGAFTGVRLAVALTQGIALALDRPALGVSTLAALACAAPGTEGPVLAAIDARMGEVYVGRFGRDGDEVTALDAERVLAPESVPIPSEPCTGVGSGFSALSGRLRERMGSRLSACDPDALPRAASVARLAASAFARGEAIDAAALQPAYLRDRVALTLLEQHANRAR